MEDIVEEDTKIEEETKKEDCPLCKMDTIEPILIAIGSAHGACQTLEDPEKKASCDAWAAGIDPMQVTDAKEIFKGALQHAGMKGLNEVAVAFNQGVEAAIIEDVQTKLDNGEEIDPEEMAYFKRATVKRGI